MTDQFCPACGVTWDLHYTEDDCQDAEDRADNLERLERLFWGGVTGR